MAHIVNPGSPSGKFEFLNLDLLQAALGEGRRAASSIWPACAIAEPPTLQLAAGSNREPDVWFDGRLRPRIMSKSVQRARTQLGSQQSPLRLF